MIKLGVVLIILAAAFLWVNVGGAAAMERFPATRNDVAAGVLGAY